MDLKGAWEGLNELKGPQTERAERVSKRGTEELSSFAPSSIENRSREKRSSEVLLYLRGQYYKS